MTYSLIIFLYLAIVLLLIHPLLTIFTILYGMLFLDVPFVPTGKKVWPYLFAELEIVEGDVVYDLGCGDARFLIQAAKKYPDSQFVGVELNTVQFYKAKFYLWLAGSPKNIKILCGDFYKIDFSDATKVFVYLLPKIMKKIFFKKEKIRNKKIKVVSRAFEIDGIEPDKTITLNVETSQYGRDKIYTYNQI